MKKKNNVMMVATIAITLLMIGCVIVMGINRNSNRNNPDVKPPEQTTDTTDTTTPDQTTPEIPPITDDGKGTDKPEDSSPADITIDVIGGMVKEKVIRIKKLAFMLGHASVSATDKHMTAIG